MRNVKKVAIVGLPRTGKSTFTRLLCEGIPTSNYTPTVGLDIERAVIGDVEIVAWDCAGEERFRVLWDHFLPGASVVLVFTDSTYKNVMETKELIAKLKKQNPTANYIIIANKQDMPGALKPEEIENILGIKTIPMIASDPSQRSKAYYILRESLQINNFA